MEEMKNRCANYDKEFECCKVYSDWSEAMPALQPCIESPCKYFKPYTNYDRIKSMSVEEIALAMTNLKTIIIAEIISHLGIVPRNIEHKPEKDLELYTQWLLQEVSENE